MSLTSRLNGIKCSSALLRTPCDRPRIRAIASTNLPKMPDCEHEATAYNGPRYEDIKAAQGSCAAPSLKPFYRKPLLIHQGRAQWLWDHTGKRYLDMFGGIATVSVGHCHPRVVAAMTDQAAKLNHTSSIYMHPRLREYCEKLTARLPDHLDVVYLMNSGSEANELAFLMARVFTGAHHVLSLRNCYHGGSHACSACTALSTFKYPISQAHGHLHMMNPDVYRGPWGDSYCRDCPVSSTRRCSCSPSECSASDNYFREFEDAFRFSLPKEGNVAGFIAESIQGIGGVVQYPRQYLQKVYELIRENRGLCIADEVQTGFGRTGDDFWGFEGHGVRPDIVTMAKGIGNGFPLAAVATTSRVADCLNRALHFNTFGGNPVACAVGSAVLDVIEEEDLQANAAKVGTYLLHRLGALMLEFPNLIGDVRGKGLMIGVELIDDRGTKRRMNSEHVNDVFEDLKDLGVLVGRGGLFANVLRLKPPMCVTEDDANFTVEVVRTALRNHQDRHLTSKESVFLGGL